MSTYPNEPSSSAFSGSGESAVLNWLNQVQSMSATAQDEATARSLRLAHDFTQAALTAYRNERERGADTIDVSSAFPTALAHVLVAIGGITPNTLSLLEVVRILSSETYTSAERLAAIAEEQLNLPRS